MERGNDFGGVLTRGEIEVLPSPDQPSIVYFSLISFFLSWIQEDSGFSKVVSSLLTALSVGTALLAEGGRRLFLKKTNDGENLSELRLVWTCESERRSSGSLA